MAICLAGGLRQFELTGPSLVEHLLAGYEHADVFVVAPLDADAYKVQLLGGANVAAVRLFEPVELPVDETAMRVLAKRASPRGRQGLLQYLALVEQCGQVIEDAEAAGGFAYSWVLRTRPDGLWSGPPPPLASLDAAGYYIPHGSDYDGLNDRLSLANRSASRVGLAWLSTLPELRAKAGAIAIGAEKHMEELLKLGGLLGSVRRARFPFCVLTKRSFRFPPAEPLHTPVVPIGFDGANGGKYCWPCRPARQSSLDPRLRHISVIRQAKSGRPSGAGSLTRPCVTEGAAHARQHFAKHRNLFHCVRGLANFKRTVPTWEGPSALAICIAGFRVHPKAASVPLAVATRASVLSVATKAAISANWLAFLASTSSLAAMWPRDDNRLSPTKVAVDRLSSSWRGPCRRASADLGPMDDAPGDLPTTPSASSGVLCFQCKFLPECIASCPTSDSGLLCIIFYLSATLSRPCSHGFGLDKARELAQAMRVAIVIFYQGAMHPLPSRLLLACAGSPPMAASRWLRLVRDNPQPPCLVLLNNVRSEYLVGEILEQICREYTSSSREPADSSRYTVTCLVVRGIPVGVKDDHPLVSRSSSACIFPQWLASLRPRKLLLGATPPASDAPSPRAILANSLSFSRFPGSSLGFAFMSSSFVRQGRMRQNGHCSHACPSLCIGYDQWHPHALPARLVLLNEELHVGAAEDAVPVHFIGDNAVPANGQKLVLSSQVGVIARQQDLVARTEGRLRARELSRVGPWKRPTRKLPQARNSFSQLWSTEVGHRIRTTCKRS
eukprot:SM000133S26812  [mRNA]  locus=s133:243212:251705:+ [translate_table: standard]